MKSILDALRTAAFAAAVGLPVVAQALTTLEVSLGPAIVNGNQAQMDVTLMFSDDSSPSTRLNYFQLDVSQSSPELIPGGTDFSKFSFTPSALLANWGLDNNNVFSPVLDFSFGPQYALGVDTSLFPNDDLPSGIGHLVGTLNYDISGLPAGNYSISVEFSDVDGADGTLGFYRDALNPQSPDEIVDEVTFGNAGSSRFTIETSTSSIPEPATFALGMIGLAGLATRRVRYLS